MREQEVYLQREKNLDYVIWRKLEDEAMCWEWEEMSKNRLLKVFKQW